MQSHHHGQNDAVPGSRTALGLSELSRDQLPRGTTITLPGLAEHTETIDVLLERSPRLPADCTPCAMIRGYGFITAAAIGRRGWC